MAYATTTDLQTYLGGSLPPNPQRLLDRATEVIEYYTFGKIQTSNADEAEVASKATCQQVEFWMQQGEDGDISGNQYKQISIGTWNATFADGFQSPSLAPRAKRTLFLAGMLYRGVRMI